MRHLNIFSQTWPVDGTFRISRSTLAEIAVVRVEISQDGVTGRGECRPYSRYDETLDSVTLQIESIRKELENRLTRHELLDRLPAGAARNAVDCALWDLAAKHSNKPVWQLAGLSKPKPRETAFTLSIDTPEKMAHAAQKAKLYPVLKLKIGPEQGLAACLAVGNARPDATLIIDANEALRPADLPDFVATLGQYNVALIEQPLPAGTEIPDIFDPKQHPIICADESLHTADDLPELWDAGYRAVNVKLDKCGGLTAGLTLMQSAKDQGFKVMAGCMVGTSLAMAPMVILESFADYVDLDGPLLLSKDVKHGLTYEGPVVYPPLPELWG